MSLKSKVGKKVEKAMRRPWFKLWPEEVPKHIDYPEIPLFQFLVDAARKYPENTAIVYFDRQITYKELDMLTNRFATALKDFGLKKGDKVAILLPNIPSFIIAYYGALKAGAVVTTISPLHKEPELKHQLNDSEAETIVVLDLFYPKVEKIQQETKIKRIVATGLKDYMPRLRAFFGCLLKKVQYQKIRRKPNIYLLKELLDKYPPKPQKIEINPKEDLAALQYTGGTTGTPKGVMLTHMNLVSNAIMCKAWLTDVMEGKETFLAALPLFHIYGMTTSMNAPIYIGGKIVLMPRFEAASVLRAIQKHRVTVFCGVPTMYALLLTHLNKGNYDCTSLRFCISGSAPLQPEIQKKFMEATGSVLVEGYGLTESSPVTHCNPLDKTLKTVKLGSIGIPWPDTEAKIVDVETGERELPPGEDGELAVRGPQVMKGYWKMREETEAVLRKGWLYTGDIGKMDGDGYFYITDRKKDLIKYKGYSVYSKEIEDILCEHPAVKLCAVVGKPDSVAGEIPKAFVVLKEGVAATEKELMDFVNEKVAFYKAIREVEFRKELPLTSIGKVLKRVLQEEERMNALQKLGDKETLL